MADKMMRMAGRGDDGLAKALKTDDNGNVGVFHNGVDYIKVIALPREIRKESDSKYSLSVPKNVTGFIAVLNVYEADGIFTDSGGVNLLVRQNFPSDDSLIIPSIASFKTSPTTEPSQHVVLNDPNTNYLMDVNKNYVVNSLRAFGSFHFTAEIRGTFTDLQGVDCELIVYWLKK